jgi:hypothetical protein
MSASRQKRPCASLIIYKPDKHQIYVACPAALATGRNSDDELRVLRRGRRRARISTQRRAALAVVRPFRAVSAIRPRSTAPADVANLLIDGSVFRIWLVQHLVRSNIGRRRLASGRKRCPADEACISAVACCWTDCHG